MIHTFEIYDYNPEIIKWGRMSKATSKNLIREYKIYKLFKKNNQYFVINTKNKTKSILMDKEEAESLILWSNSVFVKEIANLKFK